MNFKQTINKKFTFNAKMTLTISDKEQLFLLTNVTEYVLRKSWNIQKYT